MEVFKKDNDINVIGSCAFGVVTRRGVSDAVAGL